MRIGIRVKFRALSGSYRPISAVPNLGAVRKAFFPAAALTA